MILAAFVGFYSPVQTGADDTETLTAENLDGKTFAIANFASNGNFALTAAASKANSVYLAREPVIASTGTDGIPILYEDLSCDYVAPIAKWTFEKVEDTTNQYYISTTYSIAKDGTYTEETRYLYISPNSWRTNTTTDKSDAVKILVEEGTGEYAGKFTFRTITSGISGYRYLTSSATMEYFANEVEDKFTNNTNNTKERSYMTLCRVQDTEIVELGGKSFAISNNAQTYALSADASTSSTSYLAQTAVTAVSSVTPSDTLARSVVASFEVGKQVVVKWTFEWVSGTTNRYRIYTTYDSTAGTYGQTKHYLCANETSVSTTTEESSASTFFVSKGTETGTYIFRDMATSYYLNWESGYFNTVTADPQSLSLCEVTEQEVVELDGKSYVIAMLGSSTVGSTALSSTAVRLANGNQYLDRVGVEAVETDETTGIKTVKISPSEDLSYSGDVRYDALLVKWTFERVENTANQYYVYTTTCIDDTTTEEDQYTYYNDSSIGTTGAGETKFYLKLEDGTSVSVEKDRDLVVTTDKDEADVLFVTQNTDGTFTFKNSLSYYLLASSNQQRFISENQSRFTADSITAANNYNLTLCDFQETETVALNDMITSIVSMNLYSSTVGSVAELPNHALTNTAYTNYKTTLKGGNPTNSLTGTSINAISTSEDKETGLKLLEVAGTNVALWKLIHIPGTLNKYLIQDTRTKEYLWLGLTHTTDAVNPTSTSDLKMTTTIDAHNIVTITLASPTSKWVASGTHEGQVALWGYSSRSNQSSHDITIRWYGTDSADTNYFTTGYTSQYAYGNLNSMYLSEVAMEEISVSASFYGLSETQLSEVLGTSESPHYQIPVQVGTGESQQYDTTLLLASDTSEEEKYTYYGVTSATSGATYRWIFNSRVGEQYVFAEENYNTDSLSGYLVSTRVTISYINGENEEVTVSGWLDSTAGLNPQVIGGTTTEISFENYYTQIGTGALSLIKTSEMDQSMLSGAEFTLTGTAKDGTTVNLTATSTDRGAFSFSDIPVGTYILTETEAPTGYLKSETTWTVEVEDVVDTSTATHTVTVSVYKNDENGSPIETTGNSVYFKTAGIAETNPSAEDVTITQVNYEITNEIDPTTLVVEKTFTGLSTKQMTAIQNASTVATDDEGNTTYSGYRITLTNDSTDDAYKVEKTLSLSDAIRTGNASSGYTYIWTLDGCYRTSDNTAAGTALNYTLTEQNYESTDFADVLISAYLYDYDGNETVLTDNIAYGALSDNSETASVTTSLVDKSTVNLTNHYTKTFSLHLTKIAKDTKYTQSGVSFDIYGNYYTSTTVDKYYSYEDENGELQYLYWIATITTDENGLATLDDLLLTTYGGNEYPYVLVEKDAPSGYEAADPIFFEVTTTSSVANGDPGTYSAGVYTMTVEDPLITRSDTFTFQKIDGKTKGALSGASFALYECTCTDSTHNHENELLSVDETTGDLTLAKQRICWSIVASDTSTADGLIQLAVEDISTDGSTVYRLVEYAAPEGYSLPAGQWKLGWDTSSEPNKLSLTVTGSVDLPPAFEAVENGSVTSDNDGTTVSFSYRVANYTPASQPLTGSVGALIFTLGGVLLMAAAIAWVVWVVLKRKK